MTLPLPFLVPSTRIRGVTFPLVALLFLVLFAAACDSTGGESAPATPDPQTPSTPTPSPPPAPPPPAPPDAPTGLQVVGQGATDTHMFIDLEWDAVPDAALYRVEVDWDKMCRFFPDRLKDPFSHRGLAQRDLQETDIDLEVIETTHRVLLANQQQDYCFRVRAENSAEAHSPWSETITGRTAEVDANHTPSGFEMRTFYSEDSISFYFKQVTWQPVAGAYGYGIAHDTRAVSKESSATLSRPRYSADRIGNYTAHLSEHGCIFQVRVCTLYDEDAALRAMQNQWSYPRDSRGRENYDEAPIGCSEFSDVHEFAIEIPGGGLPLFGCR